MAHKLSLAERQLALYRFLELEEQKQPGRYWQTSELLSACKLYRPDDTGALRQLQRDLKQLHQERVIERIPGSARNWRLGQRVHQGLLDTQSALAIKELQVIGRFPILPRNLRHIDRLFTRADQVLAETPNRAMQQLAKKVVYKPWVAARQLPEVPGEVYDLLMDACLQEKPILFSYRNLRDKHSQPRGNPLGMIIYRGILYLVLLPDGDDTPRHYSLHRIAHVETIPNATARLPAHWKGIAEYATRISFHPDKAKTPEYVRLRFSDKSSIQNLIDAPFLDCKQHIEESEIKGQYILTAHLTPNRELLNWLLYYGRFVEVLEPDSLRRRMRQELKDMLALYQNA
ncbi:MAG TPA: WYL domain-containing protein [Fluviicoccus sp.]|nr:WYL domain-containing protein [Fluviicoccus sp.]